MYRGREVVRGRRGTKEVVEGELETVSEGREASCNVKRDVVGVVVLVVIGDAELGDRTLNGVDRGGDRREGWVSRHFHGEGMEGRWR